MTGDKRLLIIDDEKAIGEFIRKVGEMAGFEVRVTATPASFKTELKQFRPSVIVLDIMMPDTDGIELVQYLAREKVAASVLLVSGSDMDMLRLAHRLGEAHSLRMLGVMVKPLRAGALREVLNTAMHPGQ